MVVRNSVESIYKVCEKRRCVHWASLHVTCVKSLTFYACLLSIRLNFVTLKSRYLLGLFRIWEIKRRYVHWASLHVTCVKLDFLCLFTFYKTEFCDTKIKIFARIVLYMIGRRKLVFLEWQFQFSSLN